MAGECYRLLLFTVANNEPRGAWGYTRSLMTNQCLLTICLGVIAATMPLSLNWKASAADKKVFEWLLQNEILLEKHAFSLAVCLGCCRSIHV